MEKKYRDLFSAFVFITFCLYGLHTVGLDIFSDFVRGENDVGILSVAMSFFVVLGFALLVSLISRKLLAKTAEEADANARY